MHLETDVSHSAEHTTQQVAQLDTRRALNVRLRPDCPGLPWCKPVVLPASIHCDRRSMNKRRADPLTCSVVSGDVTAGSVVESDGESFYFVTALLACSFCLRLRILQLLRTVRSVQ
jgi:hypothetical protein